MLALAADIQSGDLNKQMDATTKIRKLLSKEKNPPIQEAINANIVPRLVEFLRQPNASNIADGKGGRDDSTMEGEKQVDLLEDDSATSSSDSSASSTSTTV